MVYTMFIISLTCAMPSLGQSTIFLLTMLTNMNTMASRLSTVPTPQERLHAQLLHDYDKTRVPIDRQNLQAVNVSIYMYPYDILYVREAQSSIKLCGWIDMFWRDPQLIWAPEKFGDMNETFIVRSLLWLPEIDIYYRKDEPSPIGCAHCPVHVDHDGRVLRGFYFAYSYPCKIDVTQFPFDEHKCSMQIANWHMDDRYMDLYPVNETVDLSIFLANEEWLLISCTVTRSRLFYSYGHFPILTYTLHIKRKPFFYICNLVLPSFFLTLTALVGFHMSSMGSGMHQEKVKMGLTTILAMFFLQAGVSDKLPRTSDSVPLIAKFYASMVGLLSFAILSSSFVIGIEKQGIYKRPVPKWMCVLFRLNGSHDDEHHVNGLCPPLNNGVHWPLICPKHHIGHGQSAPQIHNRHNPSPTPESNVDFAHLKVFLHQIQHQIDRLNERQEKEDEIGDIRTDWLLLADRVENVLLVVFICAAFAALAWFMISGTKDH